MEKRREGKAWVFDQRYEFHAKRLCEWPQMNYFFQFSDLQNDNFNDETKRETKVQELVIFLLRHYNGLMLYSLKYIACEMLMFAILIGCILLNHVFLNYRFLTYGFDTLAYYSQPNDAKAVSPMMNLFPLMSKCTIYSHGPSGDVQYNQAMCMLTLNIYNDKMYLVIWTWFFTAFFLSMLMLASRLVTIINVSSRVRILYSQTGCSRDNVSTIVRKGNYGDFFMIHQLCLNVDAPIMVDVLKRLAHAIKRYDAPFASHKPRGDDDERQQLKHNSLA